MKLNNKFINGIFIAMLLPFFFGCEKSVGVFAYAKIIGIHYVDNEGNILHFDNDGGISFLDFAEIYSKRNIDSLESCPIEVLSFTDENGIPVKYKLNYAAANWFQFLVLEHKGRKKEHSYIIKYKIPLIAGESVEELRVTLKETDYGVPDGWYNCQYNGKNIHIYTLNELYPGLGDPQRVFDEEKDFQRVKEMLYNGDLVGVDGGKSIGLSLPVDIAP